MIRLGMIGCGGMSRTFFRQMEGLADRLRFSALVDIDLARARQARTLSPVASDAEPVADYHDILDEVDAVIIALPHDLHHRTALDFLAAGKHVLLEKPMAISEPECLDLVAAATTSPCVLMTGYVMRFDPLWSELGRLIKGKAHGDVFHVSVWTEQYTNRYDSWGSNRLKLGGGQLFSHGCHYIDLLLHWLGEPEEGTHVGTNFGTPWMEMEGTSNVAMRFKSGALGYHFGTWGARGSRHRYAVHAHCTEGMLELDHAEGVIRLWRDGSGGDLPALAGSLPEGAELESPRSAVLARRADNEGKPTRREVAHFLDCIETGTEPITHARMATQSLRVIWRLYDAERRKTVADLRGLGLDQFIAEPLCADCVM